MANRRLEDAKNARKNVHAIEVGTERGKVVSRGQGAFVKTNTDYVKDISTKDRD